MKHKNGSHSWHDVYLVLCVDSDSKPSENRIKVKPDNTNTTQPEEQEKGKRQRDPMNCQRKQTYYCNVSGRRSHRFTRTEQGHAKLIVRIRQQ